MCVRVHVCMCMCVRVRASVCVLLFVRAYLYLCACACGCECMCVYVCAHDGQVCKLFTPLQYGLHATPLCMLVCACADGWCDSGRVSDRRSNAPNTRAHLAGKTSGFGLQCRVYAQNLLDECWMLNECTKAMGLAGQAILLSLVFCKGKYSAYRQHC